jgi:hypothetical protein
MLFPILCETVVSALNLFVTEDCSNVQVDFESDKAIHIMFISSHV